MNSQSSSWTEVTLGEVCEFKYGKSLPEAKRMGGEIPVYGSNGIVGYHSDAITDGTTIVVGRKGSYGEVNLSLTSCWTIDTTYYIDRSATDSNLKWLAYRLANLGLNKLNKAAAVPGLNREDAYRIKLLLPPIAEQKRIAAILDKAEELRGLRRQALGELEALTQSIFLEMFGNVGSTSSFLTQPLESLLKQPLQNGAYFQKEAYVEEGGIEMVHMSDAFYEVVVPGNLKQVLCSADELAKYRLSENDLLIARRSLNYEGAAKPCLIPNSSAPLIFESSFIRVTPNPKKIDVLFLFHYLSNEWVRRKCIRPFVTQSTISGINQSNLARVPVLTPPLSLQQEFARRVEAIEQLKATHRESLAHLDTLFASLQHRAFRGEL